MAHEKQEREHKKERHKHKSITKIHKVRIFFHNISKKSTCRKERVYISLII